MTHQLLEEHLCSPSYKSDFSNMRQVLVLVSIRTRTVKAGLRVGNPDMMACE